MNKKYEEQKKFWEHAGDIGYGNAVFSNAIVEKHIISKQWKTAIEVADSLNLNNQSRILELGCGDGTFADQVLSKYYAQIDASDVSNAAIQRANSQSKAKNIHFYVQDLTTNKYQPDEKWDGAFLMGFLHHVKQFTPDIISHLPAVCPKLIVLEPNGDNLIRKGLELLPSYKLAGEDSFRLNKLLEIFALHGYKATVIRRINLIPQFLPEKIFPILKGIEGFIEPAPVLNRMCSTYVIGFTL
jgi:SAM-dependent methyltransferase